MKLVLKNIGTIKSEFALQSRKLTVICGGNNTGKTYAMYILWALFRRRTRHKFAFAQHLADQVKQKGSVQLPLKDFCEQHWISLQKGVADGLRKRLNELFSAPPKFFDGAQVTVEFDKNEFIKTADHHTEFKHTIQVGESSSIDMRLVKEQDGLSVAVTALEAGNLPASLIAEILSEVFVDLVLRTQVGRAFLLPAERGGLNIFYPDLDAKNSALIRSLKREETNPILIFQDLMIAQYAEPIDDYIQFLKRIPRLAKTVGHYHDEALALQQKVTRVRYKVSKEGIITAKPYRSEVELGIHLTSSTVKNFYGLWAWLELQAKPGDCLMIDEPELNLHPDNQRIIARLLVRLVNRDIRVVISTHSDYIIRELNNTIMLSTEFPEREQLERRFGYDEQGLERLDHKDVAAYHFTEKNVDAIDVSPEFGIEVKSMDSAINNLNESNSEIYFKLNEALHPLTEHKQVNIS